MSALLREYSGEQYSPEWLDHFPQLMHDSWIRRNQRRARHQQPRHDQHLHSDSAAHATDNVQQTTCNRQHATCNMQQTACNRRHASCIMRCAAQMIDHRLRTEPQRMRYDTCALSIPYRYRYSIVLLSMRTVSSSRGLCLPIVTSARHTYRTHKCAPSIDSSA